ncbi:hypothetical protein K8S19_09625 [bacterium]|nr:hypothetical protein [bacterium]
MKKFFTAGLMIAVCLGLGAVSVSAEETVAPISSENTAFTTETIPTQVSEPVPGKPTAATRGYYKEKWMAHKLKRKELELNWNVALGMSTYSENDESYELPSIGAMLEINPGVNVTTVSGLDFGTVIGFLILASEGSFNVDYEGTPQTTRKWEVEAMSAGSYVMAKYSYDIDLNVIKIGLENGVGLGYFINSVTADWVDSSDSDIRGDSSDEEFGWAPVVKAGLKIVVPVTDVSSLGLNAGANLIPMMAGDYINFITISAGLNFQVKF